MKIFLCGGGSGNAIREATTKFGSLLVREKPLLYIPLAMEEDRYESCFDWIKKEMGAIDVTKIVMVSSAKELSEKNFEDYSAIYIGGGNTYKLLKEIKDSNSFDKIVSYIKNDGIVFGGSAGVIIFGKDINSCMSQDKNDVNLIDTHGFNILSDYSLLCHLNRNDGIKFNRDLNSEYLLDFSKENKTIYLPDDDTIYINDNQISLIGHSEYRIYENGNYITVKPEKELLDL